MNGNRGAKGSIKDRLISMLYRLRYNKKKQKESEYTVPEKKKKVEYINTLQEFKETEDVNLLDSNDKKALDKVEFNAYFVQEQDSRSFKLEKIQAVGTIESPIDIKKEKKKAQDEVVILKEVTAFVNKGVEIIEETKAEVQELKEETKDKNQDLTKLEEKEEKLRKKVDKLKEQFDSVKEKYDFSEFSILENIKLIDSVQDYKSIAALDEMEMMLNACKKEMEQISGITIVYEEAKKVGKDLSENKEEQTIAKVKFKRDKEKLNELSSIEKEILAEIKKQQELVDGMYGEASRFEKKVRTQVEYVGFGGVISSMLRIAGGILTLPFTGLSIFGLSLGATMINKGIKRMNKSLEKREKLVVDYEYEDISRKISGVKDKLEYTRLVLSDSLSEIRKLKDNLNEYFKEYSNVLPEYEDMIHKVDELEGKLLAQQERLAKVDDKLEKEREMNNQKLKKIGK